MSTASASPRVIARLAWRTMRRERSRSLLVVAVIALPVALAVAGSIGLRSSIAARDPAQVAGSANLEVSAGAAGSEGWRSLLPAGSRIVDFGHQVGRIDLPKRTIAPPVVDAPVGHPLLGGRLTLRGGRAPSNANEVALSPDLAKTLGVRLGDEVALAEPRGRYRLTGFVVENRAMSNDLVVLQPGALRLSTQRTWLIGVPMAPTDAIQLLEEGYPQLDVVSLREADDANDGDLALLALVAGLALFEAGLLAAAALSVGARRQLRTLGLLGAVGADRAAKQDVLLLSGVALGGAGSCVGAVVGIAAGIAVLPVLERVNNHVISASVILPGDLLAAVVLGISVSAVSALVPARWASKVSITDALAARPPASRSRRRRWNRVGAVAVVAGLACVVVGAFGRDVSALLALAGTGLTIGGFALICPPLLEAAARLAPRLPVAGRIALRDLGRNPQEAGFAVAAIMVALAVGLTASTVFAGVDAQNSASYELFYGRNHIVVTQTDAQTAHDTSRARAAADEIARELDASVVELARAISSGGSQLQPAAPATGTARGYDPTVAIGGRDLVAALGGNVPEPVPAGLRPNETVVYGSAVWGQGHTTFELTSAEAAAVTIPVLLVDAGIPPRNGLPSLVMSAKDATALSLGVPQGWLVSADHALGEDELAAAERVAIRHGEGVVASGEQGPTSALAGVQTLTLAVCLVTALAVLAIAMALSIIEREFVWNTMSAVGMPRRSRRMLAAAHAFSITGMAAAVAVPAGLLPGILIMAGRHTYPVAGPWSALVIEIALLPAAAALLAAGFTSVQSRTPAP